MKKRSEKRNRLSRLCSVLKPGAVIAGGVLCLALFLALSVLHAANTGDIRVPTLFFDDAAWEKDNAYPAEGFARGGTQDFWIPLCFFETIPDMKVKRGPGKTVNYFVVSNAETGIYLSFDAQSEYAQTERGTLLYLKTLLLRGERYLPMRDLCAYFGWDFEFELNDAYTVVRITDGGQKKTFAELLVPYLPETETETEKVTEKPVDTDKVTEKPPVTEPLPPDPPVTEPTTQPPVIVVEPKEVYRAEKIRLTFEGIEPAGCGKILDILAEYRVKATFFVTGEELLSSPETVAAIFAAGHSVGLRTMTDSDAGLADTDALLSSLSEENELFYQLFKRKQRLVRLPEGTFSGNLHLTDAEKSALADAGYSLWDWNVAAMDYAEAYDASAVYEKVRNAFRSIRDPVVRFRCTDTAAEALPLLLDLIDSVPEMHAERISEADMGVVFP